MDRETAQVVARRLEVLSQKLESKRVQRLLSSDSAPLEGLDLDAADALVVSRAARRNPRLQLLNLNSNRALWPQGAAHLAEELLSASASSLPDRLPPSVEGGTTALTALFVSGCGLGDAGLRHLARALPANRHLRILEARNNAAGDVAAEAFAEALGKNATLESLYLNNDPWCRSERRNRIGDAGARALALALRARSAPLKVSLAENAVSGAVQDELRTALGRRLVF